MYENPDENRQIHAKCLPFFKISPIYAWKITPFSWFREFAPTFVSLPRPLIQTLCVRLVGFS